MYSWTGPAIMLKRVTQFTFGLLMFGVFLLGGARLTAQTATSAVTVGQTFTGTTWVGQFYNTTDLSGTVVAFAQFPTGLNKNWGTGSPTDGNNAPISGVNPDNFSARFAATETIGAGTYQFTLTADDGARLSIDGVPVIDTFSSTSLTSQTATVQLSGGTYTLIVEYVERSGNAVLQLSWTLGAVSGTVGPTGTTPPLASAQVTGVRGQALRSGPYLGASLVNVLHPGKDYTLLARNMSEGIYTWYLVQVNVETTTTTTDALGTPTTTTTLKPSQTGWTSGRYITLTGNPDALPVVGTLFDQIDTAALTGVTGTTRSVMNLRIRPSARTTRLAQIPWGASVAIIGRTVQDGKNFWYHVYYEGKVGWILASYVTVRGNMDLVPIR
jgi:hypothetical protein